MNVSFANPCRNADNEGRDTLKATQVSVGPKEMHEEQGMPTRKPHPPELMGKLGDEIYEQDIKPLVEPDHNEEIVAIDVDSRKWALGRDEDDAIDRLRNEQPEAFNIQCLRVGSRAVYFMRGGTGGASP